MLARRARGWCFTANLPDGQVELLDSKIPTSKYCVYQYESGTHRHIQGYVYFENARTGKSVKKAIKDWCGIDAHLEVAKGSPQQNKEYCTKEDTRIEGTTPVEHGEIPQPGVRTDLVEAWDAYKDNGLTYELLESHPKQLIMYGNRFKALREEMHGITWKHRNGFHPKKVIILWGESGTGKTRQAAEENAVFAKYESRYTWGHYRGEPVVCFDEFNGQVGIEEMLTLCDGYNASVQVPYMGNMPWIPHTVYICSNTDYLVWWEKAKPEQVRAFWRRVTKCIKFTNTAMGVLKQYQKGGEDEELDATQIVPPATPGPQLVTGQPDIVDLSQD